MCVIAWAAAHGVEKLALHCSLALPGWLVRLRRWAAVHGDSRKGEDSTVLSEEFGKLEAHGVDVRGRQIERGGRVNLQGTLKCT